MQVDLATAPSANRRNPAGLELVLLAAAVAVASVFALLYATRPVVTVTTRETLPSQPSADKAPAIPPAVETPPPPSPFEPTSLTVEQVVVVHPGGGKAPEKVVAKLPVLYQTGLMHWSAADQQRALAIKDQLATLARYQLQLADEVGRLEAEWAALTRRGLPLDTLRADSPSLPPTVILPVQATGSPTAPSE